MAKEFIATSKFKLNTDGAIPAIGLGTWQLSDEEAKAAVQHALEVGYRYVDTAHDYGNEQGVGLGIAATAVPRSDLFVTTKLDNAWHTRCSEALDGSLKRLGLEYVDLFLMHWPSSVDPQDEAQVLANWDFVRTWAEMQKLPATGKCRAIGVSNMGIRNLERLLAAPSTSVVPAVNQVELHPYNPSPKLVQYCQAKGIHLTAYSCLGSTDSKLLGDEVVLRLAQKYGKSPAQVLLRWGVQHGWDVIPKSKTEKRIEENWHLDSWVLGKAEMKELDSRPTRVKVCDDSWLPEKVFFGDDE